MHVPTALWSKGPLSQCLQKVCHVDGLQLVLTNSFLKYSLDSLRKFKTTNSFHLSSTSRYFEDNPSSPTWSTFVGPCSFFMLA